MYTFEKKNTIWIEIKKGNTEKKELKKKQLVLSFD